MSKRTDTELIFKGLSIFKFNYSKFYYCRIYVGGRKHIVKSTGEVSKINARKVSEEMYLDLKQKNRVGVSEQKTFRYFSKLSGIDVYLQCQRSVSIPLNEMYK